MRSWVVLLLCLIASAHAAAQQGMTRAEFYSKLESYFDRELIADLDDSFAGDDYRFYSWDAGDFSGDGNYDLACAVRRARDNSRRMYVYLFADIDGFLTRIAVKEYRFIELPLEVGVTIRYGVCYITEKLQQYDWRITGYRFDGIALVEVAAYRTQRIGSYTLEQTLSYPQLRKYERWSQTRSGNVVLERRLSVVPIYPRGFLPGHGFQRRAVLTSVDYVERGAFYWSGPEDCSMSLAGAYDSNYLYLAIEVRDDELAVGTCDSCPADRLELWFDLYAADSVLPSIALRREKRGVSLRQQPDAPLAGIGVQLGNFRTVPPNLRLMASDSSMLTRLRMRAMADVLAHAERNATGYMLRVRIPWLFLASQFLPPFQRPVPMGVLIRITDVDNEFRPEETTLFDNAMYQVGNIASEGEFLLMPVGQQFGSVEYVFLDRIVEQLRRRGF
ncbi:MAG: hypothetical protein AA908_04180 [Chlorobi bacterium NICIL-2]|nr:MAG: hypothetical protein AA908_04180 [Chlorobi bacterium NICIL-2]